jgi:hypothetical protein
MSKLHNDIPRMIRSLKIIEQYNNFKQLGGKEDIDFLKEKVNNLLNIKNTEELIKEFTWCAKMINMYITEIDPEFKKYFHEEEKKKEKEEFS